MSSSFTLVKIWSFHDILSITKHVVQHFCIIVVLYDYETRVFFVMFTPWRMLHRNVVYKSPLVHFTTALQSLLNRTEWMIEVYQLWGCVVMQHSVMAVWGISRLAVIGRCGSVEISLCHWMINWTPCTYGFALEIYNFWFCVTHIHILGTVGQ
jgi:hypothetical protein